jgi:hypothetical protein
VQRAPVHRGQRALTLIWARQPPDMRPRPPRRHGAPGLGLRARDSRVAADGPVGIRVRGRRRTWELRVAVRTPRAASVRAMPWEGAASGGARADVEAARGRDAGVRLKRVGVPRFDRVFLINFE